MSSHERLVFLCGQIEKINTIITYKNERLLLYANNKVNMENIKRQIEALNLRKSSILQEIEENYKGD